MVYVVALGVQMSLLADVRIGGAAADIMLGLAIAGGLVAGAERGVVAAFAVGILYDLLLEHARSGCRRWPTRWSAWVVAQLTARLLGHVWWFNMLIGTVASAAGVLLYACLAALFGVARHLQLGPGHHRGRGRHRERAAHARSPAGPAVDAGHPRRLTARRPAHVANG